MLNKPVLFLATVALTAVAGPVEFGMSELQRAIAARGLNPRQFAFKTEVTSDPAESYRISPGLIAGGDLRGIMYGLLDAAEQVRTTGRVRKAQGLPALAIRGVRLSADPGENAPEWLYAQEDWQAFFRTLARNRFNHLTLETGDSARWVGSEQCLQALRFISETAAAYGIDFAVATPATTDLGKVLRECPAIRGVELRKAEDPGEALMSLRDVGRRITVALPTETRDLAGSAGAEGLPVRLTAAFPGEPPFARRGQFDWILSSEQAGSASGLPALIEKFQASGAGGFQIAMPESERLRAVALDKTGGKSTAFFLLGRFGYEPKISGGE